LEFPVYRKYSNNKSYFKVLDKNNFEEIQFIGSQACIYQFEAAILPDRHLVNDMINLEGNRWEAIERSEYESAKQLAGRISR
jgi:hypothetical protein